MSIMTRHIMFLSLVLMRLKKGHSFLVLDLALDGVVMPLLLSPPELLLVHPPDTPLFGLETSEVFVEREIVTDGILEKTSDDVIRLLSALTFHVCELLLKYVYFSWNQI